jgi:hypothetical protein
MSKKIATVLAMAVAAAAMVLLASGPASAAAEM